MEALLSLCLGHYVCTSNLTTDRLICISGLCISASLANHVGYLSHCYDDIIIIIMLRASRHCINSILFVCLCLLCLELNVLNLLLDFAWRRVAAELAAIQNAASQPINSLSRKSLSK